LSITIAISGKGGVGKTTISALVVKSLNAHNINSVLAVDADSNVNLNELLGVETGNSIGEIREEMKEKVSELPGGMTKQQFLEFKIHQCLVETEDFDLITVGRPEGPGCYCYSNNLLRDILKEISENYEYTVIDNEAGMEHLSRRTVQHIDYLLIISDPSVRGIRTAGKISRLLKELESRVSHKYLIINRAVNRLSNEILKEIEKEELELLMVIDEDSEIRNRDSQGLSLGDLSFDTEIFKSINSVVDNLFPEFEAKKV